MADAAPELEPVLSGSVRAVYAVEGQSVEDKSTVRRQTVELIVVESQRADQDVFSCRLAQDHEHIVKENESYGRSSTAGLAHAI